MAEFNFATETVELPSKGQLYPKDSPLSSGKVVMKYMTAREEDILSNQNYIKNGTVFNELLKSLIVDKIDVKDLIIGDRNALLVAARVLGYGASYSFKMDGVDHTVDLSKLENNVFELPPEAHGSNRFEFTLPMQGTEIAFKFINGHDEDKISKEVAGYRKISPSDNRELSTRFKYIITEVNGDSDRKTINDFVDGHFLAGDARALREHIRKIQPDVDLTFMLDSGEEATIPIDIRFFGLTFDSAQEYRKNLYSHLHSIVFNSKGAYDYMTIYNMPRWLRLFTFKELDKYAKDLNTQINAKPNERQLLTEDGKVNVPDFMKGKTSYK